MKIISNFRDYYDHVAFRYGGGDPKIVYVRPFLDTGGDVVEKINDFRLLRRGQKVNSPISNSEYIDIVGDIQRIYYHRQDPDPVEAEITGLVIGNIFFLLMKRCWGPSDKVFHTLGDNDLAEIEKKFEKRYYYWGDKPNTKHFVNHKDDTLIDLCRFVGRPVFTFSLSSPHRYENVIFSKKCPNLGDLGIGKYITDEEMYQHLSYFVGNLIKTSPDMMPEYVVADKDKILQHGFDYKTSFRNVK